MPRKTAKKKSSAAKRAAAKRSVKKPAAKKSVAAKRAAGGATGRGGGGAGGGGGGPDFKTMVSDLYSYWTLDSVVEVSHAVFKDLLARPKRYRRLGQVSRELADFVRVGTNPQWPDRETRALVLESMLGPSDSQLSDSNGSPFASLREAAVRFSERVLETGIDQLRRGFADEVRRVRNNLTTLEGAPLEIQHEYIGQIAGKAAGILKHQEIADTFGQAPPSNLRNWPFDGAEGNGADLIKVITAELVPDTTGVIDERKFQALQDVAKQGKETLRQVLDTVALPDSALTNPNKNEKIEIEKLIQEVYTWETALRAYQKP